MIAEEPSRGTVLKKKSKKKKEGRSAMKMNLKESDHSRPNFIGLKSAKTTRCSGEKRKGGYREKEKKRAR